MLRDARAGRIKSPEFRPASSPTRPAGLRRVGTSEGSVAAFVCLDRHILRMQKGERTCPNTSSNASFPVSEV